MPVYRILTLWAVAVISVMKLGSLLSISSINIASGTLLTLSYTIPPLFHVASMSSYKEIFTSFGLHHRITTSQIPSSSLSSTASLLLFLLSSFSTLIVSLWLALGPIFTSSSLSSYPSVLHQIIEFMQSRSPSTQQVMFTMLSMYFGYLGLLLLLTYPASSLRRYCQSSMV